MHSPVTDTVLVKMNPGQKWKEWWNMSKQRHDEIKKKAGRYWNTGWSKLWFHFKCVPWCWLLKLASVRFMDRAGCWWWFWCNTATRLSPELCLLHWEMTEAKDIMNPFIPTLHFKHTCSHFFTSRLLLNPQQQTLAFSLWISVSKAHCSIWQQTYMSSRGRACWLISHLAADDLWTEWPYRDKVCEHCTFNYRSEGRAYISMQHPSPLLLIALQ